MRKVVLDTNVLISGVIASGYSASILDAARREEIKLVTSAHLLEEFSEVISRVTLPANIPRPPKKPNLCLTICVRLPFFQQASRKQTPSVPTATMILCWLARWMNRQIALFRVTPISWV